MSFKWLNEPSVKYLNEGYLIEGMTAQERIRQIAETAEIELGINGFADKFYGYMSKGYYSLSSPVWSNYGLDRGLPISCFGSVVDDTMSSILFTQAEIGMMSKFGGGTSAYLGNIRPRGSEITNNGTSKGIMPFLEMYDVLIDTVSQGTVRRGQFSPYLSIEHPEIERFMEIGNTESSIHLLQHGVTITDKWFDEMRGGDKKKRELWAKLLGHRISRGYPYMVFIDRMNNNTVDVYKDLGLKIFASNLCTEIALPAHTDWSFVCNLSSMNVLYFDEWKNTDAVETLVYFLDAVMSEFIRKLEALRDSSDPSDRESFMLMRKAYNFAVANRAMGIGVLGYHSYLMSNMIPLESIEARKANVEIFKTIKEKSWAASKEMAEIYGEPSILKGYGRRHATLTAVAPTTSSSFIHGQVSQGIQPFLSNYYVQDLAKMKHTYRNPYLTKRLRELGKDTPEVWESMRKRDGSVQHLDFLSELEKNVFKTFGEIDQRELVTQAGLRQDYLDQSQSLNVMINMNTMTPKQLNEIYTLGYDLGVKTFYYQYSTNAAQQFSQQLECASCQA